MKLQGLTLNRTDCREWLRGFASWLHERAPEDPGLLADFTRHLSFFERLDTLLDDRTSCTADWLLANIPVHEMRQHLQVMTYLESCAGLTLSVEAKREAVARDRIADLLRHARAAPYGAVIGAYADALNARGCGLPTQRQYLATAVAFCQMADVADAGWGADALPKYLDRHPGQRLNIGVFVRFCQNGRGWKVAGLPPTLPSSSVPAPSAKRFKEALDKLESQGARARPADIARLLARAFSLRVAALQSARLDRTSKSIILVTAEGRHRIPKPLHGLALQWEASASTRGSATDPPPT